MAYCMWKHRILAKKATIIGNMLFVFIFFFNDWVNNYSDVIEKVCVLNVNKSIIF